MYVVSLVLKLRSRMWGGLTNQLIVSGFFFRSLKSLKFCKVGFIMKRRTMRVSVSWLLFPPGSIVRMQGPEMESRKMGQHIVHFIGTRCLLVGSTVPTQNFWNWASTFIQLSHCLQTISCKVSNKYHMKYSLIKNCSRGSSFSIFSSTLKSPFNFSHVDNGLASCGTVSNFQWNLERRNIKGGLYCDIFFYCVRRNFCHF